MSASAETMEILSAFVSPDFERAIGQAVLTMDPSERVVCAGFVGSASNESERPAADEPSPYYAVTTAGLHYGLLKKKRGRGSGAVAENRFVPRRSIASYETDGELALDLRSSDNRVIAELVFRDAPGRQFLGGSGEPVTQELPAIAQLENVLRALGLRAGAAVTE